MIGGRHKASSTPVDHTVADGTGLRGGTYAMEDPPWSRARLRATMGATACAVAPGAAVLSRSGC